MKQTQIPRILIIGGGFAGIEVAKTLLESDVLARITLISKLPYFEYYPGLYKLVTGGLVAEAAIPYNQIFHSGVEIVEGEYKKLDQGRQVVVLADGRQIEYDFVVLALGSETNYFNIPGLAEFSYSFKSAPEALRLKRHFLDIFNNAAKLTREELVVQLNVVIVGAGPSGVELAGSLYQYLARTAREYNIDPGLITIDLVEAAPRVLPMLSEKVSKKAAKRLRKMGVNIFVNRAVQSEDLEHIILKDMELRSQTLIWTAGTRINSEYNAIEGIPLDVRKRVAITETLNLPNDNRVFIAGDGAGTKYSGLAQTAMHDGEYIGETIADIIECRPPKVYEPRIPSCVIPIGDYWAIYTHKHFFITGLFPWILRNLIDLKYLLHILSIPKVVSLFIQGRKYRKNHSSNLL